MRWRKTQGFDLSEDGREAMGVATAHGDELPLVTSTQPRVTSPTQISSPVSPQSLPSTPLTAVSTSTLNDDPSLQGTSSTAKTDVSSSKSSSSSPSSTAGSPTRPKTASPPVTPDDPDNRASIGSPSKSKAPSPPRDFISTTSLSSNGEPATSPQRTTIHITSSPSSTTTSPQRASLGTQLPVVISPQRSVASPQRTHVSPLHTPTSPTPSSSASPSRPPSTVTVIASSRPSSQVITNSPSLTGKDTGSLVLVVNGSPVLDNQSRPHANGQVISLSQQQPTVTTTTTIPIGSPMPFSSGNDFGHKDAAHTTTANVTATPPSALLNRKNRKSHSKSNSTDSKRSGHEKSKSVTIVVNDQHVTYSNTPSTYTTTVLGHSNGVTNGNLHHHSKMPSAGNGETVFSNGHSGGGKSDYEGNSTRPSSSASTTHMGTKGDPDIQYLSGEAGGAVAEDTGEAWGGVLSGICGVILVLGAASFLRLPRLLYEYGAGSFLAAWCAVLLLVAAPLAYLESGLSQFSSSAAIAVWRLVPIARGVGWSTAVVCFYWLVIVMGYLAPLIHYILIGIQPNLLQDVTSELCTESLKSNLTNNGDWAVDYFRLCVYNLPETWHEDLNLTITWPLPVGVAVVVAVVTMVTICGTRLLAGIMGVMAIVAVLGASLQLSMGLTEIFRRDLDLLWASVKPFLMPEVDVLLQPWVWCAALAHVFLSLGLGIGLLMNFSSRGAFRFTLRRHLWGLVILLAVVTALVSAVTILQLTLLADDRGLEVGKALSTVISEYNSTDSHSDLIITVIPPNVGVTAGTAVITASHIIAVFVLPYDWLQQIVAFIIFLGIFCGGITTGAACLHALIAALRDASDCLPRTAAVLILTPLVLGGGIATSVKSGAAVLALLDSSVLTTVILWPPFTLTLAVTSVYGIHKVRKDFTFMLETTVCLCWIPIWGFIIPASLLGVVIWACVSNWPEVVVADGPVWRTALIWGLRVLVVLPVPITATYVVKSQLAYGVMDKIASSLQSSREWGDWGPQDPIEHHNWRRWREDETRPITSLKRRLANRPLTYTHSTLSSESSSTLTRLRNKYQRNGTASIL